MPVALRGTLQGVSFADYVEVDTCASVCGALTDEDIIAQVAGAQPVAEEPGGEEDEDDEVPVRPSASEVMEALNVTRLFFSFEEGEEDSLRRVRALEQRAAAVAFREKKHMKIKKTDIARKYGIAQSILETIIKNASKIDAVLDDDVGSGERKRIRAATYGDVEVALYKWFVDARARNVPLNGPILLAQAKRLGFALGHEKFNQGNGWLQRFKDCHGIACKSIVADNTADLKMPLVKAVFFASGAWRDMKSETILHCFEKAGFSRGSSAAKEITAKADIDAAAVNGAAAVTSLGQLWEAACNASLVPSGSDYLDFALADQDLVAMEELTTDELAASVSEKGMAADSSSSDGEGDDIGVPQPGTAGAALAAVDTLHMYLCSEPGSCDLSDNVEHSVVKCVLAKRVQGTLDRFFQKV
ncbi:hypothetical protein HPB50_022821 [Hyalomma asiaticum]|uniref:Uncharacterized protein n=1 Tax=Hyalomma asiaticum TaxID=266040 RepID=A0ACB7TPQ0_HYAAI|nr:hypothetical protein HPB50_022821 [Hyalomma asiaticum]